MIYKINNRKLKIVLKDESIQLSHELEEKVNKNFESIKSKGANVWNGEVICVSECDINDDYIKLICKKTNYAHYLYGERIGCPQEYECKNLSAGCLIETIDGYYVIGELDDTTSYPKMLQTTGGGIDKKDIVNGIINVENTIIRETMEELNIDLNNVDDVLYNKLSYIYISDENKQPGIQLFSKAKIKKTLDEMSIYFNNYYKYLKQNSLEVEFNKLHFIQKEKAIEDLKKLENPKRNYLVPLLQIDLG